MWFQHIYTKHRRLRNVIVKNLCDSVWYWKDSVLSFSSFLFFASLAAGSQIQIWDPMILFAM